MNNLRIVLYHPTLDLVSDRTFRELLKKLSSLSREIQAQEALFLINSSFLEPSEKQSIRDRIRPDLDHIPAYYVEKIQKGSLEVTISMTAFAIWLLQATVGKSIEEAWKRTKFHQWLIDYLSSERRKDTIERNVDAVINNWSMDRFLVESVQKEIDENEDICVFVLLKTFDVLEEDIRERNIKVDVELIIENGRKLIAKLEGEADKNA